MTLDDTPLGEDLPPALTGLCDAELHWRTRPTIAALQGQGHPALRALQPGQGTVVLCQVAPWTFDADAKPYLRTTARRTEFLVARLLDNLAAQFGNPVAVGPAAVGLEYACPRPGPALRTDAGARRKDSGGPSSTRRPGQPSPSLAPSSPSGLPSPTTTASSGTACALNCPRTSSAMM